MCQDLYDNFDIYVRPYEMFSSEVDHEKYPNVNQQSCTYNPLCTRCSENIHVTMAHLSEKQNKQSLILREKDLIN